MPKNKKPIQIDFKVCVIEERKSLKLHNLIKREVQKGKSALYISRKVRSVAEDAFRPLHKEVHIQRISPRAEDENISQLNDVMLYDAIEKFLKNNTNTLITILNFEIFIKWLRFEKAFAMLQKVLELTRSYPDCAVILAINPEYFTEEQVKAIKSTADRVIPPVNPIETGCRLDAINTPFMEKYFKLVGLLENKKVNGIPVGDILTAAIEKAVQSNKIKKERMSKTAPTENKEEEDKEPNPYESEELASLPWYGCSEKQ